MAKVEIDRFRLKIYRMNLKEYKNNIRKILEQRNIEIERNAVLIRFGILNP